MYLISVKHSCLESLPNELLFMITAHLTSPDLVQAFYGLNHRLNVIVCELVRYFTIPKETLGIAFNEYHPCIRNVIEKICFDIQLLSQIFPSTYYYSNLRSVVLKCSDFATVDLNVDCNCADNAIHSCLDVLQVCNILPTDWNNDNSFGDSKYCSRIEEGAQVRI